MKKQIAAALLLMSAFLVSCQQLLPLLQQMNVQKPIVKVKDVKLTGLSLNGLDLDFKIGIQNPNSVAIKLAGFDYELLIENNIFLKGQQNKEVKIEANGSSQVDIPVSLTFKQLYNSFQALKDADSIKYTLKSGLSFDVPILGKIRIPVQTTHRVPNVKLPKIKVASLKLANISFTGADLKLALEVENPNAWSADLKQLQYNFMVNGQRWLEGNLKKTLKLQQKEKQVLELPIHLNFLEIGRSLYNLLKNPETLEYKLTGQAAFNSSIKPLGDFKLPINQSGKIELVK